MIHYSLTLSFLLLLLVGCDNTTDKADTSTNKDEDTAVGHDDGDDGDGDGYKPSEGDCDDSNEHVNPGVAEKCDGIDNNCDGQIDEGVESAFYADSDEDGFGDALQEMMTCEQPDGYTTTSSDCDDTNNAMYPGNPEVCDGFDNDCDGQIDDGVGTIFYADGDMDTYGDAGSALVACTQPAGMVLDNTDCDDTKNQAYPGNVEECDLVDNNCDGTVDEGVESAWYVDLDSDGYGNPAIIGLACSLPTGYSADNSDCDDGRFETNPGATETCNGIDDNCNGTVDEADAADASVWYADADTDGFGDADSAQTACDAPPGFVADSADCDDSDGAVNPDATEVCDGIDNDCDGSTDESGSFGESTWYLDSDSDGYGDVSVTTSACDAPAGYVSDDDDCDDGDIDVNPGETDVCDTIDNNCDGSKDESGLCPCDVYEYGGHAYMFCDSTATWSAGRTICLSYGYDLASIGDAAENTDINAQAYFRYGGKWWIGFNDQTTEGSFVWSNGEAVTYTNWHAGEPNDGGGNEDCTQLGRFYPAATWNDEPCSSSFRYVCEE